MATRHLDRLTAVDASFLHQEGSNIATCTSAAILIFEGPPPRYDDLSTTSAARLHLVPRYRQKLAVPPLETGRPLWVDDPNFNLEYHVRHTALPAPGRRGAAEAAGRRGSSPSSSTARSRSGSCGWSRASRATASRSSPRPTTRWSTASPASTSAPCCSTSSRCRAGASPRTTWTPQPEPGDDRAGRARASRARSRRRSSWPSARSTRVRTRSTTLRAGARGARRASARSSGPAPNPAPDAPLNVPIGPHRRSSGSRSELGDLQGDQERARRHRQRRRARGRDRGAARAGCTAAACAPRGSSCARWCRSRSAPRTSTATLGNRIAAMRGPLPVYVEDPVRAPADRAASAMAGLKESKQALGAEVISRLQRLRAADAARPGLAAQLLDPPLQPDRHERARAAVPALPARPRDARRSSRSPSCRRTTRWRSRS